MERQSLAPGSTKRTWTAFLTFGACCVIAGVVLLATGHGSPGGRVLSLGVLQCLIGGGHWLRPRLAREVPDNARVYWLRQGLAGKAPVIVGVASFILGVAAAGMTLGCFLGVILLNPVDGTSLGQLLVVSRPVQSLSRFLGLQWGSWACGGTGSVRVFAAWGTGLSGLEQEWAIRGGLTSCSSSSRRGARVSLGWLR